MVPDDNGGWYFLKKGKNEKFEPVKVEPKQNSWPATFQMGPHATPVTELPRGWEWGPEIPTPDNEEPVLSLFNQLESTKQELAEAQTLLREAFKGMQTTDGPIEFQNAWCELKTYLEKI